MDVILVDFFLKNPLNNPPTDSNEQEKTDIAVFTQNY